MVTFIGGAMAVVGAAAVSVVIILMVVSVAGSVYDGIREKGRRQEMNWQRHRLREAAWWFSEDAATMQLLQDLAMLETYQARDKWRKARGEGKGIHAENKGER